MIGKVVKGERVGGLLHYLFGPGRANEHVNAHLAAAWDDVASLEPPTVNGRHDLRSLAELLEQPLKASFRATAKPVWHCALRAAPEDRPLGDAEWDAVVREVLDRTGLAPLGDDGGCRWVAVRHAEDHVHLVVTLARQDGRSVSTPNDYYRVAEACRSVEGALGLRQAAPSDRTAGRRPTRAETEKAHRAGQSEAPRVLLRRAAHAAAALAETPGEFFAQLQSGGVLVRERRSEQDPQTVTGYAVAWPGDRTAEGGPVWFGGSKLAPELSWSRLSARWATQGQKPGQTPGQTSGQMTEQQALSLGVGVPEPRNSLSPQARQEVLAQVAATVKTCERQLVQARSGGPAGDTGADDVAMAVADLLAVTARSLEGRSAGRLTRNVETYLRAARLPWGRSPAPSLGGMALRRATRGLAHLGRSRRSDLSAVHDLLRATASLIDALALLRAAQDRKVQSHAAQEAAVAVRVTADLLRQPVRPATPVAPDPVKLVPRQGPVRRSS